MNYLRGLALITCFAFAAVAPADEKPDPRESLKTAIPEGIRLLEAKEYATFIKRFATPDQVKKITEKQTIEEAADVFGKGKAEELLGVLKHVRDKEPAYNDEKTKATFEIDKEINDRGKIQFEKVGRLWYITN